MLLQSLLVLAIVEAVRAHFGIAYPPWRFDVLSQQGEARYSEYNYPCAGVDYKAGNVTDWPVGGGPLQLNLHHEWTYVYVNLGLGENATNFNISLTPEFWNVSGKGTLCVDKVVVPVAVQDGAMASLQVVTAGRSGSALYSCADVRFSKDVDASAATCVNSPGLTVTSVKQQSGNGSLLAGCTGSSIRANGAAAGIGAGAGVGAGAWALVSVAALVMVWSNVLGL